MTIASNKPINKSTKNKLTKSNSIPMNPVSSSHIFDGENDSSIFLMTPVWYNSSMYLSNNFWSKEFFGYIHPFVTGMKSSKGTNKNSHKFTSPKVILEM